MLAMPIDHFGLGVPDVDAAKAYYDEFMPLVGFVREWETGYRATDWYGAQIFLYPALEDGDYSRHRIGLQHISFYVPTRADVHRVYEWAKERGHEIVHEPKLFPEYNAHFYATFFLDMHGFMLEAVTYENVEDAPDRVTPRASICRSALAAPRYRARCGCVLNRRSRLRPREWCDEFAALPSATMQCRERMSGHNFSRS